MTEQEGLEKISAAITPYYDSLTDEEAAEDRAWGEFATSQFVDGYSDQPAPSKPNSSDLPR